MDKKIRKVIMFVVAYILMFWVGFRSGEIYSRMYKKAGVRREPAEIQSSLSPSVRYFYIADFRNYGHYTETTLEFVNETDTRIRIFLNKRLRHLLKLRKMKIYTLKGVRIY